MGCVRERKGKIEGGGRKGGRKGGRERERERGLVSLYILVSQVPPYPAGEGQPKL